MALTLAAIAVAAGSRRRKPMDFGSRKTSRDSGDSELNAAFTAFAAAELLSIYPTAEAVG